MLMKSWQRGFLLSFALKCREECYDLEIKYDGCICTYCSGFVEVLQNPHYGCEVGTIFYYISSTFLIKKIPQQLQQNLVNISIRQGTNQKLEKLK